METYFRGPLFIVGAPRSGTKLLRTVINGHPNVAIPQIETEFLPYWCRTWPSYGNLSARPAFDSFAAQCRDLPFFVYLRDAGADVDVDRWWRQCRDFTPAGVFEALIRVHLGLANDESVIWGDKSPSYLTHMTLLKVLYPRARFVHIVRDVRDFCLSMRKAWGKNMFRAAQRWSDDVAQARRTGRELGGDYLEIRYEDLLGDAAPTVGRVCSFLGIAYDDALLDVPESTENLGDARGRAGIVASNVGKYRGEMRERDRLRIEAIAGATLRAAGYECDAGPARRLSAPAMSFYQLADGLSLLRFAMQERGLIGAAKFVSRYFRISGNRQATRSAQARSEKTES